MINWKTIHLWEAFHHAREFWPLGPLYVNVRMSYSQPSKQISFGVLKLASASSGTYCQPATKHTRFPASEQNDSPEIIDAILKDLNDFTGSAEQYDAMTIVVIRKL